MNALAHRHSLLERRVLLGDQLPRAQRLHHRDADAAPLAGRVQSGPLRVEASEGRRVQPVRELVQGVPASG